MKDTKIQWHPGFVSAMNLELEENRSSLIFEKEYNLNTKPLEIDLLIIKKSREVPITNEIGKHFKGHNIIEYKSPGDSLNIDTLFKVQSYAGLYKAYGKTVDAIRENDITVSLIREEKPKGLFQYLEKSGRKIENPYCGIYHVNGFLFLTQIIVIEELEWSKHEWLGALSDKLQKQRMKQLIERVGNIKKKQDREFAESVLEISMQANLELIKALLQGDDSMNEALLEVMSPLIEPQLLLREKRGIEQGIEQGELLHLIKTIYKKMLKGKTNEEISDEVEEDITTIEQIKEVILKYKKEHKDEEFNASIVLEYFKEKNN